MLGFGGLIGINHHIKVKRCRAQAENGVHGATHAITQGERPVEVIAFASTTAFGLTRDEAISRVSRQAKELKTILSSSLGCDIRELTDLDMIKCFEWEYFFPTTQEEIRDTLF